MATSRDKRDWNSSPAFSLNRFEFSGRDESSLSCAVMPLEISSAVSSEFITSLRAESLTSGFSKPLEEDLVDVVALGPGDVLLLRPTSRKLLESSITTSSDDESSDVDELSHSDEFSDVDATEPPSDENSAKSTGTSDAIGAPVVNFLVSCLSDLFEVDVVADGVDASLIGVASRISAASITSIAVGLRFLNAWGDTDLLVFAFRFWRSLISSSRRQK